jgi:hypothetical protein
LTERKKRLPLLWRLSRKAAGPTEHQDEQRPPRLYFALHPLEWWTRFETECFVSLIPWDVVNLSQERELLLTDWLAGLVYRISGWLERRYPTLAVKWWQYPVVVLDKRTDLQRSPLDQVAGSQRRNGYLPDPDRLHRLIGHHAGRGM